MKLSPSLTSRYLILSGLIGCTPFGYADNAPTPTEQTQRDYEYREILVHHGIYEYWEVIKGKRTKKERDFPSGTDCDISFFDSQGKQFGKTVKAKISGRNSEAQSSEHAPAGQDYSARINCKAGGKSLFKNVKLKVAPLNKDNVVLLGTNTFHPDQQIETRGRVNVVHYQAGEITVGQELTAQITDAQGKVVSGADALTAKVLPDRSFRFDAPKSLPLGDYEMRISLGPVELRTKIRVIEYPNPLKDIEKPPLEV